MSFHYQTQCDACGKRDNEGWDHVPDGWISIGFNPPILEAENVCPECARRLGIPESGFGLRLRQVIQRQRA